MMQPQPTSAGHDETASWLAIYRLEGAVDTGWRDADVRDVSETGAKLVLRGLTTRSEVLDGPLELHLVTLLGRREGIRLRGEIRHVANASKRRVLVDIEFIDQDPKA